MNEGNKPRYLADLRRLLRRIYKTARIGNKITGFIVQKLKEKQIFSRKNDNLSQSLIKREFSHFSKPTILRGKLRLQIIAKRREYGIKTINRILRLL